VAGLVISCASQVAPVNGKRVPEQRDSGTLGHLMKSDIDRLADVEMHENTQSLRVLMTKLYKRNPAELKKSTSGTVDEMVGWVFEGDHKWNFEMLGGIKETDAIYLAFKPDYKGDRVLAFVVGLQTMMIKARGGKTEFSSQIALTLKACTTVRVISRLPLGSFQIRVTRLEDCIFRLMI